MSPGSGGGGEAIIGVQAGATFGNAGVGGRPGGMRRRAACAFNNAGDIRPASDVGALPAAAGMPTCAVDHSCGGDE